MNSLFIKEVAPYDSGIHRIGYERCILLAQKRDHPIWGEADDSEFGDSPKKKFKFIETYNKPEYKIYVKYQQDPFNTYYELVEAEYKNKRIILDK